MSTGSPPIDQWYAVRGGGVEHDVSGLPGVKGTTAFCGVEVSDVDNWIVAYPPLPRCGRCTALQPSESMRAALASIDLEIVAVWLEAA